MPQRQPTLKMSHLIVENFGPVKKAAIDFENITVLTGPYNTGKTCLATLAYVFGKVASYAFDVPIWEVMQQRRKFGEFRGKEIYSALSPLLPEITSIMKKRLENSLKSAIERELIGTFSIQTPSELIRSGEDETTIKVYWSSSSSVPKDRCCGIDITINKTPETIIVNDVKITQQFVRTYVESLSFLEVSKGSAGFSYAPGAAFLHQQPLYIPAERLFALSDIHSLLQLIIAAQGARSLGYETSERLAFEKYKGMLRPVLLSYLQYLMGIWKRGASAADFGEKADKNRVISKPEILDLIDGEAYFDSKNLTAFYKNKNGSEVPLSGASSGVAQLVSLLFSLPASETHLQQIPFIVIEEPEINLHANHHLKIAAIIAKISQVTNLIVTTHSEYVLEKLTQLWAQNQIVGLNVYFIDPDKNKAAKVGMKKETGEIALLRTIDETVEALAGEAVKLLEKQTDEAV